MGEEGIVGIANPRSFVPADGQGFSAEPGAHYDRITDAWQYLIGDDLHVGYFEDHDCDLLNATRALTRMMADAAALGPGSEVLDVGCGTGGPAVYLALDRRCRVRGISTSSVGIARASARALKHGVEDSARFTVADGTANGFADDSFDCVWVMESSHLIPQKDLLIKECARVLRSQGTIVLCDLMLRRPIPAPPEAALRRELMTLERAYGKTTLFSQEAYIRECEANGLHAEGRDISEPVIPTFSHWRQNAVSHADCVRGIFGADQLKLFVRSCEILTHLFRNGQLGYGLVTGKKTR